jgi:hypothetical protein
MSPFEILLHALGIPFGTAFVVIAVLRPLLRLARIEGADRAAVAVGMGVGYLAGHAAVAWPSAFPPVEVTDRIPFVVLAAILLGLLESAWPSPLWARWENRFLMTALVLGTVLGPLFEGLSGTRAGVVQMCGIAVAILVFWANLEALACKLPPSAVGLMVGIVTAGAGLRLLLAGNMVLFQLLLALGASLGAAWLFSLWRPAVTLTRGGAAVLTLALASLLIYGQFYSIVPEPEALAIGLAAIVLITPLLAWVAMIGPIRRRPTWLVCLVVTLVTIIPVAITLVLAWKKMPEPAY